jgi:hypothetical protein
MRGRSHLGNVGKGIEMRERESEFTSARFLRRLLGEETKCDRVKISRPDGYRPLKLSSGCDCIVEEDGESSRHDHSRE